MLARSRGSSSVYFQLSVFLLKLFCHWSLLDCGIVKIMNFLLFGESQIPLFSVFLSFISFIHSFLVVLRNEKTFQGTPGFNLILKMISRNRK